MVKITDQNKKLWDKFVSESKTVHNSDGQWAFEDAIKFYNNPGTEVWVGYVSNRQMTHPNKLRTEGIEMYISITTSEHAPFTTHMGIQRVECAGYHKHIANKLHTFCAKVIHERYPEKLYMIFTPEQEMFNILLHGIYGQAKTDAEQGNHHASEAKFNAIYKDRTKFLSQDTDTSATILNPKDGSTLVTMTTQNFDGEFKWMLDNSIVWDGREINCGMICIDLPVLSELSLEIAYTPLSHCTLDVIGEISAAPNLVSNVE